jgi:glycosyltransferase involved in cell wall biosynthesis
MRRKILQVVGAMNRGGVETWLMTVLRHIDKQKFQMDFLVHSKLDSAYDEEIRSLGGAIHYCTDPKNPWHYAAKFRQVIQTHGPFDVVHSHVYWYTGYVLRLAHRARVPIRIAHSHTATQRARWNPSRRLYQNLMRSWILRHGTHRIGISKQAAEALFGPLPVRPCTILNYGLDFTRFQDIEPSEVVRRRLGIPPGRGIIGHVGRFMPVKNHVFMVELLECVISSGTDAHLMLVGDGPLLSTIKAQIEVRGLSDRCTFAGEQSDVTRFFSAMDVFVLPSHYEGLGIVAVESQAAGVPVVASTGVPEEVDVIPQLVEHIPLSAGAVGWASAVSRRLRERRLRGGDEVRVLQNSRFGLSACMAALSDVYLGGQIGIGVTG